MGMMERMMAEGIQMMAEEASEGMKREFATLLDKFAKEMDSLQQSYLENADARNAEAFKVLDASGDGTLQLDEFIAAFQPETEKFDAFVTALGLKLPEPTKPSEEEAGECPQQ